MCDVTLSACADADILLMSAAVADFRPANTARQKIKKADSDLDVRLVRTSDILSAVSAQRQQTGLPRFVVGFAAESEKLTENARAKLAAKGLDMIVANDITAPEAGFAFETNQVVLLLRDGTQEQLPLMTKTAVAEKILGRVASHCGQGTERRTQDD
jgi:phosphopantothenoylcysteine decarboxylase/phosphopantothenate--cysteine ligase